MNDYSQSGEQLVVLDFFENKIGTFLSLGENDGITLSNVRALALNGWAGLCVEPVPSVFEKLQSLYLGSAIECLNIAVADFCGEADFFESGSHLKTGDHGLLSTLNLDELKRWKGREQFTPTRVKVVNIIGLLKMGRYTNFDFISIDLEGTDFDVLRQFDFKKITARMVCVETNNTQRSRFNNLMFDQGFRLHFENFENSIYSR